MSAADEQQPEQGHKELDRDETIRDLEPPLELIENVKAGAGTGWDLIKNKGS